jgi:DNA polymerase-3 subunit alpha
MLKVAEVHQQPAIAITDHGTLAGAWDLAEAAKNTSVKPIIGIEAYLVNNHFDPVPIVIGGRSSKYYHITLLAQNAIGYQNLIRMNSLAWDELVSGTKPLVDFEMLSQYSEGVIALTGCLSGSVMAHLARKETDKAIDNLDTLTQIFDRDHLFVEFMSHGIDIEDRAFDALWDLANRFGLETVVTNDAHFTLASEAIFQEAQLALSERKRLIDPNHWRFDGEGYHLRSSAEMWEIFGNTMPRGLTNTLRIASMVEDRVLPEAKIRIPKYTLPGGVPLNESSADYLHKKILEGAHRIYGGKLPKAVTQRLTHEYRMIVSKGFEDYFLVVADMLDWARSQGILVGPGRGSAAGSLVAYCLDIVKIDALQYGLLFERFLNPDRVEMPDIDSDFEHTRRNEVIQYLVDRWGADNVSRIGSFGYLRSKQAIKDAAYALGNDEIGTLLSKYVAIGAGGKPESISTLMDESFAGPGEAFRQIVADNEKEAKPVIELALGLEDSIRSNGVHACGILVSTQPINDMVPTRVVNLKDERTRVTEWEHHNIADLGLLKLDALGLKTLGVASSTLKLMAETRGVNYTLDTLPDPNDLSLPDVVRAWEFIGSGNTSGIFQLESPGMQRLCVRVQPQSVAELAAVIALYRPGPMGMSLHEAYADVKRAGKGPDYQAFTKNPQEIEAIDTVLGSTIGIPIYQEQLMALSGVVAGFSASSRERVRKAVSKKIATEMDEVGRKFLIGAQSDTDEDGKPKMVFDKKTAQALWDAIKSAGAYAFNASHAVGYAQLSWTMAYLRANWPLEMAAGMLSVAAGDGRSKVVSAVRSVTRSGVRVRIPNINVSRVLPAVVDDAVVLGFSQILGISDAYGERIVAARETDGPFASISDFIQRVPLNQKAIVMLAEAGALDDFGPRLGIVMAAQSIIARTTDSPLNMEWTPQEKAWREVIRLGVLLSVDLLKEYKSFIAHQQLEDSRVVDADRIAELDEVDPRMAVTIKGVVSNFAISTKGARRANIEISGTHHTVQGVIWGDTLTALFGTTSEDPIRVGDLVVVTGRPSIYRQKRITHVGLDALEGGDENDIEVEETIAIPQIVISKIVRIAADEPSY